MKCLPTLMALYLSLNIWARSKLLWLETPRVRLDFEDSQTKLTNRLMWTPAALARRKLANTRHRFDFFGLMYLSPGLGMFSFIEGMYLLHDGRIAVTIDVDRPWVIERDSLRVNTPVGRRDEWLPMMTESAGEVMGKAVRVSSNLTHVPAGSSRV